MPMGHTSFPCTVCSAYLVARLVKRRELRAPSLSPCRACIFSNGRNFAFSVNDNFEPRRYTAYLKPAPRAIEPCGFGGFGLLDLEVRFAGSSAVSLQGPKNYFWCFRKTFLHPSCSVEPAAKRHFFPLQSHETIQGPRC